MIGDTDGPIAPCGACRQVILELGGNDLPVVLTNLKGDLLETTAAAQLPNAFGGWDADKPLNALARRRARTDSLCWET